MPYIVYTVLGSCTGHERNFSQGSTLSKTHVSFLDGKHQQKLRTTTPPPKKKKTRAFGLCFVFFPVCSTNQLLVQDPQKEVENSKKKEHGNLGIRSRFNPSHAREAMEAGHHPFGPRVGRHGKGGGLQGGKSQTESGGVL